MDNQRMMLETQIALLTAQSKDAYFTEYLNDLLYKVQNGQITTEYAIAEVNRTHRMYLERQQMQSVAQPVQPVLIQQTMYSRNRYNKLGIPGL